MNLLHIGVIQERAVISDCEADVLSVMSAASQEEGQDGRKLHSRSSVEAFALEESGGETLGRERLEGVSTNAIEMHQ